jgi:hypothetical protein
MINDHQMLKLQMLLITGLAGAIFFRLLELSGVIPT